MKTWRFKAWGVAAFAGMCGWSAQADVLTYHNDNARTGLNSHETLLNPKVVNKDQFGLLFSLAVDGKVDACPLYASAVNIPGVGVRNVVYVVTEHDSVYAFDADSGAQLWHVSVLTTGETPSDSRGSGQIVPEIGITSTPVIDRTVGAQGTLYLVAMTKDASAVYHQRLHALSLSDGAEVLNGPTTISASFVGDGPGSVNGHVNFDPGQYAERAALLLTGGTIYTMWTSHSDHPPYTGWVIGFDQLTLAKTKVLNVNPAGAPTSTYLDDGSGNSFWMSGAGPAADAAGNIYAISANGPFDSNLNNGIPSNGDYGDSLLKFSPASGLAVADYFTPFNQQNDADGDLDFGSGGVLLVPDLTDSTQTVRHLAVAAGKDHNLYVIDRDNMGKYNASANQIYQELDGVLSNGIFATCAYFNGTIYYGPVSGHLSAFTFTNARLGATATSHSSTTFGYPGTNPAVSSNGTANGIVWAYQNAGPAVLHAYDATNLATELYNSSQAANNRDLFGSGNKFITPMIANGKVYAGTQNSVGVFGLLPLSFAAWETAHSFSGGATAIPNDDGATNLMKYVTDIDPTRRMTAADRAALPTTGVDETTTPGTTYLTVTYRQLAQLSGMTIALQSSSNMQTWTTVTPDLLRVSGTDATTGDPIMEVGVTAAGASHVFLRLQVTMP